MPIDSRHPEFVEAHPFWTMCDDFYTGPKAIKSKAKQETYLPRLEEQTDSSYNSMLLRAPFYGAFTRTVDGMVGAVMRKDPDVKNIPSEVDYLEGDAGLGLTISALIRNGLKGNLKKGRGGFLVDKPTKGVPGIYFYNTESVINWGSEPWPYVVLEEVLKEPSAKDKFVQEDVTQWRLLRLIDDVYEQLIYRKTTEKAPGGGTRQAYKQVGKTIRPSFRGKTMNSIPFFMFNVDGNDVGIDQPPLLSLVYENWHHYLASADHMLGMHKISIPTPWVSGIRQEDSKTEDGKPLVLRLGSEAAFMIPDARGRGGFMEFTGQGLNAFAVEREASASRMAAMGARLIEPRKTQQETAESARIRQSGEGAILTSMIDSVETAANRAINFAALWQGAKVDSLNERSIIVNRDVIDTRLTANDVIALLQAVQKNRLSHEMFIYALTEGGMLPINRTYEDEVKAITNQKIQSSEAGETPATQVGDSGTADFVGQ